MGKENQLIEAASTGSLTKVEVCQESDKSKAYLMVFSALL